MRTRIAPLALSIALVASSSAPAPARADIYTWVDGKGRVNVSNLTPPEGVRITSVVEENPDAAARIEAARQAAREKELQALAERVQQLEQEVANAARYAPPPYAAIPMPPPPAQGPVAVAAPVVQLTVGPASLAPAYGCDPAFDCGFGWPSVFYPGGAFVPGPPAHRFPPFFRTHQAPWAPLQPIVHGPPSAPVGRGAPMLRRG